jgi:1,4-alpha-glucan branching enzyme
VTLSKTDVKAILNARHGSPHSVLGMHPCTYRRGAGLVVRAFLRDTAGCEVILTSDTPPSVHPMKSLAAEGLFEVFIARRAEVVAYELRATSADGRVRRMRDPYCFLPTLGDQDLYLFNEGNEHRIYDKLGVGARGDPRLGRRRLQRLGRPLPPDEEPRSLGRLGDLHPGARRG